MNTSLPLPIVASPPQIVLPLYDEPPYINTSLPLVAPPESAKINIVPPFPSAVGLCYAQIFSKTLP